MPRRRTISTRCRTIAGCAYDPKKTVGADACPYNALYWDFMARHEGRFAANYRMGMVMRGWAAKPDEVKAELRERAAALRARLRANLPL